MTVPALTLTSLRAAKNSVIGNPIAKVQLVRDGVFISQYGFQLFYIKPGSAHLKLEDLFIVSTLTPMTPP